MTRRVPRTGAATLDTGAVVELVLQQAPGTEATLIDGISVLVGGVAARATATGRFRLTLTGGAQVVELRAGTVLLHTLCLCARAGLPPVGASATAPLHDVLVRLNMLGYPAGLEGRTGDDGTTFAGPSLDLERGLLGFEADDERLAEGITSRMNSLHPRSAIATRVSPATRRRLAEVVAADLGDPAPAEDATVVAGGFGAGTLEGIAGGGVLRKHRLVLLRIERAPGRETRREPRGSTTVDMPDPSRPFVDDGGHRVDTRYATDHRGPMCGITVGDAEESYQVQVVRENLAPDAPIFARSCHGSVIVSDAALATGPSAPLRFTVQPGVSGEGDHRLVDIELRAGSPSGPVVHILRLVCFRRLDIDVAVIVVNHPGGNVSTIDGDKAGLMLARCSRFFAQAGLRLHLADFRTVYDDHDYRPVPGDDQPDRCAHVLHLPNRVNIYVIHNAGYFAAEGRRRYLAIGQFATDRSPLSFTLFQASELDADQALPHALAHELGHLLGLIHVDPDEGVAEAGAAPGSETPTWYRVNAWAHRRLMFYRTEAPSHLPDWVGPVTVGNMLSLRNLHGDPNDDEVGRMRDRAGQPPGRTGVYDGQSWHDNVRG